MLTSPLRNIYRQRSSIEGINGPPLYIYIYIYIYIYNYIYIYIYIYIYMWLPSPVLYAARSLDNKILIHVYNYPKLWTTPGVMCMKLLGYGPQACLITTNDVLANL